MWHPTVRICLYSLHYAQTDSYNPQAFHFTAGWCCNRHPGTDFQWHHFFKGRLLYQDPESSALYYGDVDDLERLEILPPLRNKRKGGTKVRRAKERKELSARLRAWLSQAHSNDPLASIRPASYILDDRDIKTLSRLHSSNVTDPEQVVAALGETHEWEDEWSYQIFETIQLYDRELASRRKVEATRQKASQKRAKHEQDQAKFDEESNEVAERVRQNVLRRLAQGLGHTSGIATAGSSRTGPETPVSVGVEGAPVRRSARLQGSK